MSSRSSYCSGHSCSQNMSTVNAGMLVASAWLAHVKKAQVGTDRHLSADCSYPDSQSPHEFQGPAAASALGPLSGRFPGGDSARRQHQQPRLVLREPAPAHAAPPARSAQPVRRHISSPAPAEPADDEACPDPAPHAAGGGTTVSPVRRSPRRGVRRRSVGTCEAEQLPVRKRHSARSIRPPKRCAGMACTRLQPMVKCQARWCRLSLLAWALGVHLGPCIA